MEKVLIKATKEDTSSHRGGEAGWKGQAGQIERKRKHMSWFIHLLTSLSTTVLGAGIQTKGTVAPPKKL